MPRSHIAIAVAAVAVLAAVVAAAPRSYVLPCAGTEDYRLADGRDYRGLVNRTATGLLCQPWASDVPHPHQVPVDPSIGTAGDDNNYCRNPLPDAHSGPWCYTLSESVAYQRCDVGPICDPARVPQVEPVAIEPIASRQPSPLTITLSCATLGADIFVSLDGQDPIPSDESLYSQPITISGGGMRPVRAVAYKDGMRASAIAIRAFALELPALGPVAIRPTPPSVDYTYEAPVLVTLEAPVPPADDSSATPPPVEVYYTIDGSAPSLTSSRYTGAPFWVKENVVVRAIAVASGRSQSTPASQTYRISAPPAPPPHVRPAIPVGAVVYGAVEFSLESSVPESEYRVSVNDSAPMPLAQAAALCSPGGAASASALRVSVLGATTLAIAVSGRQSGFSTPVTLRFTTRPMPAVEILPRGGSYNGPVEVTVAIAGGAASSPVPIIVTVDGEQRFVDSSFTLDSPGRHVVEARTHSFADRGPLSVATYDLAPLQLEAPSISPDPATFWQGFLFVSPLVLTLPESRVPGVTYTVSINSGSQGAARTSAVAASSTSTVELATASDFERFVVEIRAVPTDVNSTFLLPSSLRTLNLRVAAFGDQSTPFFRLDLATDPTPNACTGLARQLNSALFLSSALGVGAQVVLHSCARRPAFRVTGLPQAAVPGYTRWLLSDLSRPFARSVVYATVGGAATSAVSVASVDAQVFADGCTAVSTVEYFAGEDARDRVSPAVCGARCLAGTNAASVLLAEGGQCACLSSVAANGVDVDAMRCGTPCTVQPELSCGGAEASTTTTLASHFGVINTTRGSSAALFPMLYGFTVATAGTISTASPFGLRISAANLPQDATVGGRVKFITESQSCSSLAPEFAFAPDGVVTGILLRRAAAYRICATLPTSAGTDDAGVFRELPPLAGAGSGYVTVVQGEDVPVTVTPASGILGAPASITVSCATAGAQLVVTLDQEAPVVVAGPTYTFVVRSLGSHLVSAHATTSGNAIGLPVTRAYTVVDPDSLLTTTAAPVSVPPSSGNGADALGVNGYTYTLTTERRTLLRLALDEATWTASVCGGAAASADCVLYVTSSATCGQYAAGALGAALQRSATTDTFAFETAAAIDLGELPMSRDALSVCIATPGNAAGNPVAPLADSWTLSSAVQGVGLCSVKQAALCASESRCAARQPPMQPELVCLCGGGGSDQESLSVFCTAPDTVPAELRGAKTWNGTTDIVIGTAAPQTAVPPVKGSYVSLFVLVLIFGASTAMLCYVKRKQPAPAAGAA